MPTPNQPYWQLAAPTSQPAKQPPAWLKNKPGAVQPLKPKNSYYQAPAGGSPFGNQQGGAPFGNQQGGSLPAWALPTNTTVYGPPKPAGYDAAQTFGNQQGGALPAWATVKPNTSATGYKPPTTPAPFYTAAQLPNKNLPQWMQDKGEQFAMHNDPAAYSAAAAATQTPQYPYVNDPATPPTAAPFLTLNDFLRTQLPTNPPTAQIPTGFGSQYGGWNKRLSTLRKGGGYGGGYSDYGSSGYGERVPSWLMNLYSWNFKG